MKSISLLTISACILAATVLADTEYEPCIDEQIDYVTDSISSVAGACSKKTGYDFVRFPVATDVQLDQFCTDCADLVAKIQTLTPARCTVNVFSRDEPTSLKVAMETLFGKCGVTNVKEAGDSDAKEAGAEAEAHVEEYGSGSHDSDDAQKETVGTTPSNATTVEKTTAAPPTPSPTSGSAGAAVAMSAVVVATASALVTAVL